MSSKTWSALKWVGGKVSDKAKQRAARATCVAEPKRRGVKCGRKVNTGRTADGVTCGRVECALWLMARDPEQTAHYLGITEKELAEQIAAVKQR